MKVKIFEQEMPKLEEEVNAWLASSNNLTIHTVSQSSGGKYTTTLTIFLFRN